MVIFQFFLLDKYTDPDPQLCLRQLGKTFGENNSLSGWRGCDVLEGDEDVARLDVQVDQLLAVDILQTLGVNKELTPQEQLSTTASPLCQCGGSGSMQIRISLQDTLIGWSSKC